MESMNPHPLICLEKAFYFLDFIHQKESYLGQNRSRSKCNSLPFFNKPSACGYCGFINHPASIDSN